MYCARVSLPLITSYWLGEQLQTNNRFTPLADEKTEETTEGRVQPKPPPIFISIVFNIKPLTELLNDIAPEKYLIKTLPNDQVRAQPLESSDYTTIITALMEKNTEFHTFKPRQVRSFRVVIRNIHPSTEVQDIKRALTEKGHDVTNIWKVKQKGTNKPLPSILLI